jgi:hypothetical protein
MRWKCLFDGREQTCDKGLVSPQLATPKLREHISGSRAMTLLFVPITHSSMSELCDRSKNGVICMGRSQDESFLNL